MQGRRCTTVEEFLQGRPGDYVKILEQDEGQPDRYVWWIRDPNGTVGGLYGHAVTEHEDGTITVAPSILDPRPGGWHGFLEHGEWRGA